MKRLRIDIGLVLALGLPAALLGLMCVLLGSTGAVALAPLKWSAPTWPPRVLKVFTAPPTKYGPGHRGVDLSTDVGAPVLAPISGVVTYAGSLAGRPLVALSRRGWRVDLEPVSPSVKVGDAVARGEVIGHLVAGGHCGARSCLHWGVRNPKRVYVNPLALLSGKVRLLPVFALLADVAREIRLEGVPAQTPHAVVRR